MIRISGLRVLVAPFAVGLVLVASAAQALDKTQTLADMVSIARQMESLKPTIATDSGAAAAYAALAAQYRQLSASMGGDDPGAQLDAHPVDGRAPDGAPSGPPPPTNCTATTTAFTQNTPVAIPTGPAVVTSTILVAGAGPFLWDVNLQTFITHTFANDLDVTIQSPAGTVVTLTTDNGGGNDNVFNGTVWDDSANPGGQVPYTTNDGVISDSTFADLVVETPLVPEEALSAFVGENPNGTWTLTVSDDLASDGGSIASWTLNLTALAAPPTNDANGVFTQNTPVAIPTGPAVVTSTINIAGVTHPICGMTLTTNITHTFATDLDVTLMSPTGIVATLTTDNGSSNDNVFNGTLWNDDADPGTQVPYTADNFLVVEHTYADLTVATPLVAEEALGPFFGQSANGTWTLTVSDDLTGDGGSIDSWSLTLTPCSCAAACNLTCPTNITVSNDPNQCGAVVNYPAPTTTGTCGTITCTPPSGASEPVATTNITCTDSGGASCGFTITVNDTQPPAITCPADLDVTVPPGSTGASVPFPPPAPTDNCPGVGATCDPASGDFFLLGTTTDACTATDASNNTAACAFDVSVTALAIQEIPALSGTGLASLAALLALGGFLVIRRRG